MFFSDNDRNVSLHEKSLDKNATKKSILNTTSEIIEKVHKTVLFSFYTLHWNNIEIQPLLKIKRWGMVKKINQI